MLQLLVDVARQAAKGAQEVDVVHNAVALREGLARAQDLAHIDAVAHARDEALRDEAAAVPFRDAGGGQFRGLGFNAASAQRVRRRTRRRRVAQVTNENQLPGRMASETSEAAHARQQHVYGEKELEREGEVLGQNSGAPHTQCKRRNARCTDGVIP